MKLIPLLFFAAPFICGMPFASAQLEQTTAIKDFAIPSFDEDGHRLWVLRGKELRRQSEAEATVLEMDLTTYAGTRQQTPETRLRSPLARFLLKGNRASSDQGIAIKGLDYEITGRGWKWNGKEQRVLIDNEVCVLFAATLTDFLASGCAPDEPTVPPASQFPPRPMPKEEGQTRIFSDKLELLTTDKDHQFHFRGDVRIFGSDLKVSCDSLKVISKRSVDENGTGRGAFGSIANIFADGHVRIEQKERSAVAGKATIDVAAGTIVLEDDPVVFDDRGKAAGHKIILHRGKRRAEVLGKPGETRAEVTLPPIRDLGGTGKVDKDKKKGNAKQPDVPKVEPPPSKP
ncbi:MAG: hypothetical protein CMI32_04600 [Opitutales bacterium]|nr:hypothetical protein [Opitutales bacterium]